MGSDPRRVRWAVALAVVAGTVVVPAAAGAPSATCAAAGGIRVRVVVDFGDAAGAPPAVSDVCVPVADRTTGAELLAARARQLGTPAPRYDGGLLCAIDGYPETGCGDRTSDGYRYWSYWHGDAGSWTYANVGPGSWKLRDGDVEGWRFLNGGPESKAAPPRAAAASCPATARATATTAAPPPTTAPRAAAAPTTMPGAVPTSTPAVTPTTTMTTATTSASSTTTSSTRSPRTENASSTTAGDDGDGGAPVGLLVVATAIVALGIAAGVRFRRRGEV
jgi:hypothetical protein